MGLPLLPTVANLFMEAIEEGALESAALQLRMWVRYVDDTFVLWPHEEDELETFHQHLNSQPPSIQFTMKKESERKISFLDVQRLREKKEESSPQGCTGRKLTLNYASHHHPKTKTGVIACLRNRAEKVCDQQSLKSELSQLKKTFEANSYSPSLLSRELHQETPQPTQSNTNDQENQDQKVIYLLYVQQTSEYIQRICRQTGVKAVFKSQSALREALMKIKTILLKNFLYKFCKTPVVYTRVKPPSHVANIKAAQNKT